MCYNHYTLRLIYKISVCLPVIKYKCAPLSENLTCLHNTVLKIDVIELYWVKNVCSINSFLIAAVNSEGRCELKYLIYSTDGFASSWRVGISCFVIVS